jgi:hypothetical protein
MQPTIHLERKVVYGRAKNPALPSQCIVGCIFNSVGFIITRESPCIFIFYFINICLCLGLLQAVIKLFFYNNQCLISKQYHDIIFVEINIICN